MKNQHMMSLILYRTFFVVKIRDKKLENPLNVVLYGLKTYTFVWNKWYKKIMRKEDKSYYSYDQVDKSYRFPICMLKEVMGTFGRYGVQKEDIFLFRKYNAGVEKLNLKFNTKDFKLRDYQQQYSDILVNERNNKSTMLVDLATGYGKTLCGNHAICRINEKVLILVLPKYMDKWIDDVKKYTDIEDSNICTIQGAKTILKLMNATKSELSNYKVYIASITTMNYLISDYESGVYTYPMDPTTFSEHLGVGVLLNDETHQHFHALLKVSLYMNVNQIIGLSATLDSNKSDMKKMYERMFPPNNRISNIIDVEKYTNVKAVQYGMNTLRGIRYIQGKQGYSHIVFEQSIIRNSLLTDSYFEMIYYYIKKEYLNRKEPGERLLVFFSTVIMCTMFTNYLKNKHPELDIRRYCQDDPYENVIEAEISVSTVISASTAVDIPKLITVINTISMASLQANIQTMGRLRKIPGREVWYIYTYNPDIPNQKTMHRIRRDTIMFRSKVIYYETYPKILRNY